VLLSLQKADGGEGQGSDLIRICW